MFTQELKSFMKMHNISSAAKWEKATNGEVSESTISRILNAKNKDIGLNTFLLMISPYGATPDEVLGLGAFSPEALEKAEIVGKLESVIERIETTEEIPPEETQEIKLALEEAQEHIASEPALGATCGTCASLRETIADLTAENELKDKWISRLLHILQSATEPERKPKKKPKRLAVRKKALTTRRAVNPQSLLSDVLTDKEKGIVWDYMVNKMSLEEITLKYYEEYIVSPDRRAELERIISPYDSSL